MRMTRLNSYRLWAWLAGPVAAAWLLGGCSSVEVRPLSTEDVATLEKAANRPGAGYRIEPGDTIEIQYIFHSEMKQEDVVRADGNISARLVGELAVAGMTTADLERRLAELTSDRLRDPEVAVRLLRFSDKGVYVGGEVGKPGLVPYRLGLSPLQAIIAAGGARDTARLDTVIFVRPQQGGATFLSRTLNLKDVIHVGVQEPLTLAPHDILYVPRTPIAEADLWVKQHIIELIPLRLTAPIP
jgi:protein involved in polysaccharide export with SLBB domain